MQIATIGLDLAKTIFQVHGVDAEGGVVIRRRLRRAEVAKFFAGLAPCLVGMEACAGAHFWAVSVAVSDHARRVAAPPRRCQSQTAPPMLEGSTSFISAEV
jgi:transposase